MGVPRPITPFLRHHRLPRRTAEDLSWIENAVWIERGLTRFIDAISSSEISIRYVAKFWGNLLLRTFGFDVLICPHCAEGARAWIR